MSDLFAVTPHEAGVVSLRIATDVDRYLDLAWVGGFLEALVRLGADDAVRAVILEGGGRYFSAGASRESLLDSVVLAESHLAHVPQALLSLRVPVIAAMAGHAIGGGLVVGLWCDAVVLASESLYGANFMALGFTPGMGATYVMPEAFGAPLGRELLSTGRLMTGREIRDARCPLSHAIVPRDDVRTRALAVARDMVATSRAAASLLKENLAARRRAGLDRALAAEHRGHNRLFADPATRREIALRYPTELEPGAGPADVESTETE